MKKTYLNDSVIVESFPPLADKQGRFRGGDERGEVTMFLSNNPVEFVEYTEFKDKSIRRGLHFQIENRIKIFLH